MQVNSSSSDIISRYKCFNFGAATFVYISFIVVKSLLIFPLYILVFYFGFQRWRQQRSFNTTSHSDIFTYHMAAMILITVVSDMILYLGILTVDYGLLHRGIYLYGFAYSGELLIHCLTCVERYLAVVHPITYMRLRQRGGVRIRNISIVCVWLMTFALFDVTVDYNPADIPAFCLLSVSLAIILFCSLSVLFVLNRPGPGDGDRVDQSKQKAFYTILAILWVLLLWFLTVEEQDTSTNKCLLFASTFWFDIPSNVVLPILFLNRAGKLTCC